MNNIKYLDKVLGIDSRKRASIGNINYLINLLNNSLPGPNDIIMSQTKKISSENGTHFILVNNNIITLSGQYVTVSAMDLNIDCGSVTINGGSITLGNVTVSNVIVSGQFNGGSSAVFTGTLNVEGPAVLHSLTINIVPVFADNTDAATLSTGEIYKTPTGQLMIKY